MPAIITPQIADALNAEPTPPADPATRRVARQVRPPSRRSRSSVTRAAARSHALMVALAVPGSTWAPELAAAASWLMLLPVPGAAGGRPSARMPRLAVPSPACRRCRDRCGVRRPRRCRRRRSDRPPTRAEMERNSSSDRSTETVWGRPPGIRRRRAPVRRAGTGAAAEPGSLSSAGISSSSSAERRDPPSRSTHGTVARRP